MSSHNTWVRENRGRCRQRGYARCSMAALGLLTLVNATACDEGEATWSEGPGDDGLGQGEPVDVLVAISELDPEALHLHCTNHETTTEDNVRAWLGELIEHGLVVVEDGIARLPGLGSLNAKRFIDRRSARRRKAGTRSGNRRAKSRDVAEDRTGQERVLPDSPVPAPPSQPGAGGSGTPATSRPAPPALAPQLEGGGARPPIPEGTKCPQCGTGTSGACIVNAVKIPSRSDPGQVGAWGLTVQFTCGHQHDLPPIPVDTQPLPGEAPCPT